MPKIILFERKCVCVQLQLQESFFYGKSLVLHGNIETNIHNLKEDSCFVNKLE